MLCAEQPHSDHNRFRCPYTLLPRRFRAAFLRQANGGHLDCAIMLLENGADVNARGKTGSTPLKYAKEEGHEAMARMLEARGGTDAALPPAAAVKRSLRK